MEETLEGGRGPPRVLVPLEREREGVRERGGERERKLPVGFQTLVTISCIEYSNNISLISVSIESVYRKSKCPSNEIRIQVLKISVSVSKLKALTPITTNSL